MIKIAHLLNELPIPLIAIVCGLAWYFGVVKPKRLTREARIALLKTRWEVAREERLLWEETHSIFDFNDPEYQKLWNLEIGAEMLCVSINPVEIKRSYFDYQRSKRKAEKQEGQ